MKSPISIIKNFLGNLFEKIKSNPKIAIMAFVAIIVNFIDAFVTFHFKRITLSGLDVDKVVFKFIKVNHIFSILNAVFFAIWDFILGKIFIA